jgi:uncharacterized protein YegJ (DUF2314 family)
VAIAKNDPTMEEAFERASATVPCFIELLQGERGDKLFAAKLPFRDPDECDRLGEERLVYLWLTAVHYYPEDNDFTGVFFEVPAELQKWHKNGEHHFFEAHRISDWMVLESGHLNGGFTLRVTRERLPDNERENYDRYIGVSVYEPLPEHLPAVRRYFPCGYLLDGQEAFLIWYSGEPDGVYLDEQGFVPVFGHMEKLLDHAQEQGIAIEPAAPGFIDLDLLAHWLTDPVPGEVDPFTFLDAWNLFTDLSLSAGGDFDPDQDQTLGIYDKLFWGNNLPAMTPEGEHYTPVWSSKELEIMADTLGQGLAIFRRTVRMG